MSAEIVPRWEWRAFGESFDGAEQTVEAIEPARIEESDEVYLLSVGSDASVKVRDELMDVKHLEQVSGGLEQWRPVLKAPFPLAADQVEDVCAALGVETPAGGTGFATLGELLDGLVRPDARLLALEVHKRRRRFAFAGCQAELTDLRVPAGAIRSLAIESEDPALVRAAVESLGLGSLPNTCMAKGLKALAGFGSHRFAVIDVGTNSVKFVIGERCADGSWRTPVDRAEVTRLGEGLQASGRLEPEPMERTAAAIAAMAAEAAAAGVEAIAAVGTAGLRIASNSAEFLAAVKERSGVEIEVIPGDEEARLAYQAATAELGVGRGSLIVFETGGGSSQFTLGDGERIDEQFSVNVGAARFTERFRLDGPVSEAELAAARTAIAAELSRLEGRPTPDAVIGLGGAVTNLAAVSHELAPYDPEVVRGTVLDRTEIDRQIELYRTTDAERRRRIVGLQPERAEVILAGACIVRTVLDQLGADSLTVSDRGLRHGLLAERFGSS